MRVVEHIRFTTDDPLFPTTITYVAPMSEGELAEIKEFLALWIRSMERRTAAAKAPA